VAIAGPPASGRAQQPTGRANDIPHVRFADGTFIRLIGLTGVPHGRRQRRPSTGSIIQERSMSKLALYVPLEAKPGKEKEVAEFLRSALPLVEAEAGTVTWYALQEGPSSFAIFDTFNDEAGRDAHLNGKVAAALMAKAADLFAKPPAIHKIDILTDKLPKTKA
jgi:quinol monooxygenase YgiN